MATTRRADMFAADGRWVLTPGSKITRLAERRRRKIAVRGEERVEWQGQTPAAATRLQELADIADSDLESTLRQQAFEPRSAIGHDDCPADHDRVGTECRRFLRCELYRVRHDVGDDPAAYLVERSGCE